MRTDAFRRVEIAFLGVVALLVTAIPADNVGPASWSYAALVVLLAPLLMATGISWTALRQAPTQWILALWTVLVAYAALSITWSSAQGRLPLMGMLALSLLVAALPFSLVTTSTSKPGDLLAVMGAIVILGSGVHLLVGITAGGQSLGDRIAYPVGGASVSGLPLVLSIAAVLDASRASGRRTWLVMALLGVVVVACTGSRMGTAMTLVLVVVVAMRWRSVKGAAAAAGAGLALGGALVATRGALELTDPARLDNAASALGAWLRSPVSALFGLGNGGVWPWPAVEFGYLPKFRASEVYFDGPLGPLLYHPHSTLLGVAVEIGLLGLGILLGVLGAVTYASWRVIAKGRDLSSTAWALIITLPAFTVEFYLLRSFPASLVWWTCVWAICRQGLPDLGRRRIRRVLPGDGALAAETRIPTPTMGQVDPDPRQPM